MEEKQFCINPLEESFLSGSMEVFKWTTTISTACLAIIFAYIGIFKGSVHWFSLTLLIFSAGFFVGSLAESLLGAWYNLKFIKIRLTFKELHQRIANSAYESIEGSLNLVIWPLIIGIILLLVGLGIDVALKFAASISP
jgi:hypothetical protein